MVRTFAYVFGIVFLVIGLLGFVPALTPDGLLLGLFEVDAMHNTVHIVSGLLGIAAAALSVTAAVWYFRVFGIVYALVTLLGFIGQDPVLGLIVVNSPDNWLHLFLAVSMILIGFSTKPRDTQFVSTVS